MVEALDLVLKRLNASDRKLLQMSVHINPILVANADGHYSMREQAAMAESVRRLMSEPSFRPLIALAGREPMSEASLQVLLDEHAKDVDSYLQKVRRLLELLPEPVADAYRRFTSFAIVHVAEASRDGLFGLVGQRISESEKALIQKMIDVLDLEPTPEQKKKLDM